MSGFPSDVNLQKVEIHATEVCNNRCTFCTTGWVNLEQGPRLSHPPRELLRQQLVDAYASGARRALFQGGEPTVRRDLGELLQDAWDLGYQATTIFTNARMAASTAGARWLVNMKVTWFQVSVQGGTAEAHDESVAAAGAFDQTVKGLRRLVELGQRVKVNGVLTRHLLDTLPEFADLMIDIRPEEVGMDTIKPSAAFGPNRESYANLIPRMSDYSERLRDAVLKMNAAGVVARLTTFPPCLVPGAEEYVAEEQSGVQSGTHEGRMIHKLTWKRSMMEKSEVCASCAYDASCGGLYTSYTDLHGTSELRALASRKEIARGAGHSGQSGSAPRMVEATQLTKALRALFVRDAQTSSFGVREVRPLPGGAHELVCAGPQGELSVTVAPRSDGPAYASTQRFSVSFRQPASGHAPDLRFLDAVVRTLQRAEVMLGSRGIV